MKKFEILQELPKCDTETPNEQSLSENGVDALAWWRMATNLQFVKNVILWSTVKENVMKWEVYLYIDTTYFKLLFIHLFGFPWS